MSGTNVEVLTEMGRELLTAKLFSVSMYCMWVYDYFLTLGDEVAYAWPGRKSWVFVLFIANRYIPVFHVYYKGLILFDYTKSLCEHTKWEINLYTTTVAALAQITIAIRLYAVTGRSKLHASALCVLILAQLASGLWFTIMAWINPIQSLPQINLDEFKVCFSEQWRPAEFSFISIAVSFDLFAFVIIFIAARGLREYPGIPNLLKAILRDATAYFFLMFACQVVLLFFLFLAPPSLQLLPGITHTMFLPMMACRLMLSLRKAASEPSGLWTLSHVSRGDRRISTGANPESGLPVFGASLPKPNGEYVELGSMPQAPRKSDLS